MLLLAVPWYVHFLGVESYGLIGLYATWYAIAGILDMGISATASREIAWYSARGEEVRLPGLVRTVEVTYWLIAVAVGGGVCFWIWISGGQWLEGARLSSQVVHQSLMLMGVLLVIQIPSGLYSAGLIGLHRQVESARLQALFSTLRIGAALTVIALWPDVRVFFLSQIIVVALQAMLMRRALWRRLPTGRKESRFSFETLRSVGGFAGGMALITALSVSLGQMDKMILSHVVTLETLGVYMLAWSAASGLMLVATPLMQSYGPRFTALHAKGSEEETVLNFRRAGRVMNVLVLPPAALAVTLAPQLLQSWTGNESLALQAAPVLEILTAGMALVACSYPALGLLYARRRFQPVLRINAACFVVLLPLLIIAIRNFGIFGAAWCWALYGFALWVAYSLACIHELGASGLVMRLLGDFLLVGATSYVLAETARVFVVDVGMGWSFLGLSLVLLGMSWLVAVFLYEDLRLMFLQRFAHWKTGM